MQEMPYTATNVCAVCLSGIHQLGGCAMGHCANIAYFQLPEKKVYVCPNYGWNWVVFLSNDTCNKYTEQEAEALATMDKEARETCQRKRKAIENIKNYMMTKTSSKK